ERLALLHISDPATSTLDLRQRLDAAFDVEAVTEKFFEDYKKVFAELQKLLIHQTGDKQWAHDYALQLLNRLLFLYFIQRKRWLGNNPRFLAEFWKAYRASGQPKNTFYDRWLSVLFFEAFNNKFHGGHRQFPEHIASALMLAPYLNGGLFIKNELDQKHAVRISDNFFSLLFERFNDAEPGFLERYNFTIAESTPLDIEVAVDPEMIGKIYESLVNITFEGITEEDLRGSAGIFYTPRVEIDLMCRLSLSDWLTNQLGEQYHDVIRRAVFAYSPEEKREADDALLKENLWEKLYAALRSVTVLDPACGSGSFLIGMLLVLDDLQARAGEILGIQETSYERRRRIIGESLYGVDIMEWSVHVAELRLWLQLVVETELQPAELKFRPLLPNLSFKVRSGDSLVQEIGGMNFGLHRHQLDIPAHLKGQITQLKGKKLRFYQGEEGLRQDRLKAEELKIFRDILDHKIKTLQETVKSLKRKIASQAEQGELPGLGTGKGKQQRLKFEEQWRTELQEKQNELEQFSKARQALKNAQSVPFVWDIAFVEIFEGEKGGFDIVIGNPPYVRQEMIAPPTLDPANFGGETSDRWKEQKKAYKARLQQSVAEAWKKFFQYKSGSETYRKLDGKSDLYVFFYFHGLSLLNRRGSFCFITSNSWLDVGYGRDLQEFLLKHSHIKFILDNERKRSFAQADVNTVIVLLAPPDDRTDAGLEKTARFVMFKVPFEDVASAETFKELEAASERTVTDRWRITPRLQRELFEESLERSDEDADTPQPLPAKTARYQANKWGGKYLRAPDIFFTILEKGKGKLVRLGDIAEVRFGIKTGANEFFYLEPTGKPAPAGYIHVRNGAGWEGELEKEFLKPILKSAKECDTILITPDKLRTFLFSCHSSRKELEGTAALDYINWGEYEGFSKKPSVLGRKLWYDVGYKKPADGIILRRIGERMPVYEANGVLEDCVLFGITRLNQNDDCTSFLACLNSTLTRLFVEVLTRPLTGSQAVADTNVYVIEDIPILDFRRLLHQDLDKIKHFYNHMHLRPSLSIFIEQNLPDRRALDDVVFDVLGLTSGEREAVYEAVINLVKARLEKAKSV
ncbi:MAG: Eco57I restriction-modification methylase domain-containing protein, partial [Chitinophagales bacterium]|nr:Eco57I restriction-modification methylase domain-containing protein [Chitinophagales bacterium]MDW8427366.1 Eco57I restriction-modification methylase domain-containing protein [Chitinophagales bacterium]